jgi:hypothetical protein
MLENTPHLPAGKMEDPHLFTSAIHRNFKTEEEDYIFSVF